MADIEAGKALPSHSARDHSKKAQVPAPSLSQSAPFHSDPPDAPAPVSDDTFGITYQKVVLPGSKPAAGYTLPTGPAFAGEREMESEANANELIGTFVVSSLAGGQPQASSDEFDEEFDGVPPAPAAARPAPPGASGGQILAPRVFSSETEDQQPSTAVGTAAVTSAPPVTSTDAPLHGGHAALQAVRAQLAAEADRERRAELADMEKRLLGSGSLAAAAPIPDSDGKGGQVAKKMAALAEDDEDDDEGDEDDEDADDDKVAGRQGRAPGAGRIDKASTVPVVSAHPPTVPPASGAGRAPAPAPLRPVAAASVTRATPAADDESLRAEADDDFDIAAAAAAASRRAAPVKGTDSAPVRFDSASLALLSPSATTPFLGSIIPTAADPDQSCLARLFSPRLVPALCNERDRIFCCARAPFDSANSLHIRLLESLYDGISGSTPSGGISDWRVVGFQRAETFETDLRGGGMLGPLNMLWLIEQCPSVRSRVKSIIVGVPSSALSIRLQLVAQLFAVSRSATQHFPLMAQSINMTVEALLALRVGKLNKAANALASAGSEATPVTRVFHELFGALWLEFFILYRDRSASIVQLGSVVKDSKASVLRDAGAAIERFRKAVKAPPFVSAV